MNRVEMEDHDILNMLNERAKELKCLYKIEEIIKEPGSDQDEKLEKILRQIPLGWQYPSRYSVRIEYEGREFLSDGFRDSSCCQTSLILVDDEEEGRIEIFCDAVEGTGTQNPFLPEEQDLLDSIAEKIGQDLSRGRLKSTIAGLSKARESLIDQADQKWKVILDLLEEIDRPLYKKIARKMLNHLCWIGIEEARRILQCIGMKKECTILRSSTELNMPLERVASSAAGNLGPIVFPIASKTLHGEEILFLIRKWVDDEKVHFLSRTLEMSESSLGDISDAVYRFYHMEEKGEISEASRMNLQALLLRRVFTEQTAFVAMARDYVTIEDFYPVLQQTIYSPNCHGKLGGKSTGLFVAEQIVKQHLECTDEDESFCVEIPKTWYIASGVMVHFIFLNNLEEILEQRYKPIEEIREEYPNIIQIFKNSNFPPGVMKSLNIALDEFGDSPIIVRSSSLLEDRLGAAFSGKYKSLFLANQGSKKDRLTALMDAIAEVYASIFGPDPIEYRREKGLLDFKEEMAIMIQEVVGTKVGPYFLPAFAGVAFSNNEFRWSPRIRREDGLVRMVPGLGTRAVDRIGDDYPKLISPGQPDLDVNLSVDEIRRYSPREVDLLNLETNSFETVELRVLLKEWGEEYPEVDKVFSVFENERLIPRAKMRLDFETDELTATFDGIVKKTSFTRRMEELLDVLQEHMKIPVDIEFASNGREIYLLQCRPQYSLEFRQPAQIPQDIPDERMLFSANRFISNGKLSEITHIVYVDPEKYTELKDIESLRKVGKIVGKLNLLLPRRQFILMGPGRWGSRGDITLGVSVTYSDISNTALLVEIARKTGNYTPDLSFGTHFFQDLVEASIHYLPLYPDAGNTFSDWFFRRSRNVLSRLLPEIGEGSRLEDVVSVIDIPAETGGMVLKVAMNGEIDKAVGFFGSLEEEKDLKSSSALITPAGDGERGFWQWRQSMAEHIAGKMDFELYGVVAVYIFGSTKNGTAGMGSDIDLLIHFRGDEQQREALLTWLDGWSGCLAEVNYLRTGYRSDGLLDVHLVTDEDIEKRTSWAVKIDAVTDAAEIIRG